MALVQVMQAAINNNCVREICENLVIALVINESHVYAQHWSSLTRHWSIKEKSIYWHHHSLKVKEEKD